MPKALDEAWLLANGVSADQLAAAKGGAVADRAPSPRRRGRMNATEARFVREVVEPMARAGEIDGWAFEPIRLLVAAAGEDTKSAWYTPDVVTWGRAGLVAYEVKGFWRSRDRVRVKVAAERHPWVAIVAVTREKGGGWKSERFGRPAAGTIEDPPCSHG